MTKQISKKEIMKQHKADSWSYLFAQCHGQLSDDIERQINIQYFWVIYGQLVDDLVEKNEMELL